jgi:TnpA family transposase
VFGGQGNEGQEDQLALGLVLNGVVLWTTRYLDRRRGACKPPGT